MSNKWPKSFGVEQGNKNRGARAARQASSPATGINVMEVPQYLGQWVGLESNRMFCDCDKDQG